MTARHLIRRLLDFDMDKEVYLAKDVKYEGEDGKVTSSSYYITSTDEDNRISLHFDNSNHKFQVEELLGVKG